MIKEFALKPDVLAASFRDFSYFIEKFGIAHGPVISRFPKDWKRKVYEAAQVSLKGTKELSRIGVRLQAIKDDVLIESRRPSGDGTQQWLMRAITEHSRQPFSGIIAHENPAAHHEVLVSSEVDYSNFRFQASGQRHITRTSEEIVACVGLLLRLSKTVKLINPHFNPTTPRWRRMLVRVMNILGNSGQSGITLEIHRSVENAIQIKNLQLNFDSAIPSMLRPGVSVSVILHPEEMMHIRAFGPSLRRAGGNSV